MSNRPHNFKATLPRYDSLGIDFSTGELVSQDTGNSPEVSASETDPKRVKNYRYDFYLKSAEDQELEILRLENELREKQNTLRQIEIDHEKELRRKNSDLQGSLYSLDRDIPHSHLDLVEKYRILSEKHKEEQAAKLNEQKNLNEKVKNLALTDTQLRRMINDLQNQKTLFLAERSEWEARERQYLLKLSNLKDMKKDFEEMQLEKNLAEQARIQMQKIVNDSLNETQKRLSASRNHEDQLIHQNAALKSEVVRNAQYASELAVRNEKLELEIAQLSDENLKLREDLRLKGEIETQRNSLMTQLQSQKDAEKTLGDLLYQLQNELKNHSHGHKAKLDEILKAKQHTDQQILDRESRISRLELENARLDSDNKSKETELSKLINQLQSRGLLESDLVRQNSTISKLRDEKNKCLTDLEKLHAELSEEARKNRSLNDRIIELLEQIRIKDDEIARLKNVRPVFTFYKAVKGDPIDEALAEVLNSLSTLERPRFEFIRDGPGIYQFGSRRIQIRYENNRLIVRVGGGYMTIREFIEVYDQIESEKSQNRASLSRLPMGMRSSPIPQESPRATSSARSTGSVKSNRSGGRV